MPRTPVVVKEEFFETEIGNHRPMGAFFCMLNQVLTSPEMRAANDRAESGTCVTHNMLNGSDQTVHESKNRVDVRAN